LFILRNFDYKFWQYNCWSLFSNIFTHFILFSPSLPELLNCVRIILIYDLTHFQICLQLPFSSTKATLEELFILSYTMNSKGLNWIFWTSIRISLQLYLLRKKKKPSAPLNSSLQIWHYVFHW
jgi:hypothetical protein